MYKYLLLFLISFKAFAFGAWIDEATIPAPIVGQTGVGIVPNTGTPLNTSAGGKVRLSFDVAKYAYEDPIVFPGVARAGHLHMFFGNTCINGTSTLADLMACNTSTMYGGSANRSGYWMPAIIDSRTGEVKKPYQTLLYYTIPAVRSAIVQPFPEGLKMVAGDSKATGVPLTQNKNYVMSCNKPGIPGTFRLDDNGVIDPNDHDGNRIPNCFGGTGGNFNLNFIYPSCWNGVDLDSVNHKDHMAYPLSNGNCPTTHPVAVPVITAVFDWHVVEDFETKYWRFSSDMYDCNVRGGYSMHMDYWAGWQAKYMNMIVNNVLRAKKEQGTGWIGIDPDTGIDSVFKKM